MQYFQSIAADELVTVHGGSATSNLLKMGWAWLSKSRAPVRGPKGGVHLNETTGAVTKYNERGLRSRQYEYGHQDPFHPPGSTGAGQHYHDFGHDGSRGSAVPNE